MIGRLCGTIEQEEGDGSVIVDVQGVGYELFVPLGSLGRLEATPAGQSVLHVHTHVREDCFTLYGFATVADRAAFRALLKVTGVGPKVALGIMNVLDAAALQDAIAMQNKAAFKGITGVGRKTVERLLIDLQDKLDFAPRSASGVVPRLPPRAPSAPSETVVGALVQMGYKRNEAETAVSSAADGADERDLEGLLRAALGALS